MRSSAATRDLHRPTTLARTRDAPGHVAAIRKDLSREVRVRSYSRVLGEGAAYVPRMHGRLFRALLATQSPHSPTQRAAGLMKLMQSSLGNRALEQTLRTIALGRHLRQPAPKPCPRPFTRYRSPGLPLFGVEMVQGGINSAPMRFQSTGRVTVESDAAGFKQVDEVGVGDFLSE